MTINIIVQARIDICIISLFCNRPEPEGAHILMFSYLGATVQETLIGSSACENALIRQTSLFLVLLEPNAM